MPPFTSMGSRHIQSSSLVAQQPPPRSLCQQQQSHMHGQHSMTQQQQHQQQKGVSCSAVPPESAPIWMAKSSISRKQSWMARREVTQSTASCTQHSCCSSTWQSCPQHKWTQQRPQPPQQQTVYLWHKPLSQQRLQACKAVRQLQSLSSCPPPQHNKQSP